MKIDTADDHLAISRQGKQKIEYFVGLTGLQPVTSLPTAQKDSQQEELKFHIETADIKEVIIRTIHNIV